MAEYYSVELAQKVCRGMTDSALACKALGHLSLGYKKNADRHILLNEQEISIVTMIFDRYIKNDKILDIIAAAAARYRRRRIVHHRRADRHVAGARRYRCA